MDTHARAGRTEVEKGNPHLRVWGRRQLSCGKSMCHMTRTLKMGLQENSHKITMKVISVKRRHVPRSVSQSAIWFVYVFLQKEIYAMPHLVQLWQLQWMCMWCLMKRFLLKKKKKTCHKNNQDTMQPMHSVVLAMCSWPSVSFPWERHKCQTQFFLNSTAIN